MPSPPATRSHSASSASARRAAGISAACSAARKSRSSPSATSSRSGSTTPSRWSRSGTPTGSKSGDYKGVKAYGDFRDLLQHPGLDAVVIATPDHWHAIPCVLAARAGKHIYCEKPLTHHIAEGRQIVDEVKKAKVIFQTGSQQRSEFEQPLPCRRRDDLERLDRQREDHPHRRRRPAEAVRPARSRKCRPERTGTSWLGPAPKRPYQSEVLCPKGVHQPFPGVAELPGIRRRRGG